jgi:DNA invertase Pin-like site-specific DNA recombinase
MESRQIRAAQYLRMSTDVQDLSIAIQKQAIREFAESNGIDLVETYEDAGKSGLGIENRAEMRRLLKDVASDICGFEVILVYDVSRWGRFQDIDASAYYEYHCRMHGVEVIYVRESFGRQRDAMSALLKSMKRTMAAEYSRELSAKVQAGHARSMELGFQMGELPAFGLRRLAIAKDGRTRLLQRGDRKSMQSERIRWVPGPDTEVALVRRVFDLFGTTDITIAALERQLLAEGYRLSDGRPITFRMLRTALSCEAFIGNFVWGRKAVKAGRAGRLAGDSPLAVRRAEGVLAPMVEQEIWQLVQAKLRRTPSPVHRSRARLLSELQAAFRQKPTLSTLDLREYGCACAPVYTREFGSIYEAMRLAGVDPGRLHDERMAAASLRHRLPRQLTSDLCALLNDAGLECRMLPFPLQGVAVGGKRVRVQSIWPRLHQGRQMWWYPRTGRWVQDYVLIVRFQSDGTAYDLLLLERGMCDAFPLWSERGPPGDVKQMRSASELVWQFNNVLANPGKPSHLPAPGP